MTKKIQVGILDDHLATVNGYRYSLENNTEDIETIWVANYYEDALNLLKTEKTDLVILDASVPISKENKTQYPIFNAIREIKKQYPRIKILVISMHDSKAFIVNLHKVGIDGYILKNDTDSIENLSDIVSAVIDNGSYYSPLAEAFITEEKDPESNDYQLTSRQIEYLSFFNAYPNLTSEEAAVKLNIAPSTLRNTLSSIYVRLRVNKLPAALVKARKLGFITPESPKAPS